MACTDKKQVCGGCGGHTQCWWSCEAPYETHCYECQVPICGTQDMADGGCAGSFDVDGAEDGPGVVAFCKSCEASRQNEAARS